KRILLVTFGCQMNEYDSELIESILTESGFLFVEDIADADIMLLNTCAVRENAERKVFNHADALRHQLKGKNICIGILGCVATHLKEKIIENKKWKIDFIVGPDSYRRLPEIIKSAIQKKQKLKEITLSKEENYADIMPQRHTGDANAWLAIMRGCDNFCSFCIVPYTRGRERSRRLDNIIRESKKIAQEGFPQITLLGQNVNSYHDGKYDFTDLLEKISEIKNIKRIRFMSPHPKDFPKKLITLMAQNDKIAKHIHLPLQSGNSRILKLMNRGYTKENYLALVEKLYAQIPSLTFTSDIIVGFPTETEEDFLDTVDVIKKACYAFAFIFKYSPREGTLAAKKYTNDVSEEIKTKRIVFLNNLQNSISLKVNKSMVGKTFDILIEKKTTQVQGRTDGNIITIIDDARYDVRDLIKVKITQATSHWLKGEPV
ncbi:MAG TPA: tRNA (N6-isopentenyl adenosine(37)-C2)-methylthiotransferase MiaB, partial [Candidatus Omnitrophota bacterium]|nr:tRNA (N6-isopentenyl adenosine(37)-C2)-methylthiotransferase MiaB [Candidatus Omnitrophota bacterium]